jgi:SAM-dependent methyltransferase
MTVTDVAATNTVAASPPTRRPALKLRADTVRLLRCPRCRAELAPTGTVLVCASPACGRDYPVVNGTPILINEDNSIFSIDDYLAGRETTMQSESRARRIAKRVLPELSFNLKSQRNYAVLADLLRAPTPSPRLLVIGGRILGRGMEPLVRCREIEIIDTDVSNDERTVLVCDAHDLPFADGSVDGVVAQAVLEHVVDPWRCVEEIHRVLTATGLVYAETPFMTQVHGGPYDFIRFTPLGHRRLFRRFEEISTGSGGGPGIVLAWSWLYFLRGFANTRRAAVLASVLARLTGFWLKYVDRWMIDRRGAQDGTWGYYFLGRRSERTLSDRELVTMYNGLTG